MFRWMRLLCVLSIMALIVAASAVGTNAFAATNRFSVAVQADGTTLGTATGVLDLTPKDGGKVTWKITEGQFAPATLADGKVVWSDDALTGTGDATAGDTITVKDISVTLAKTSGVDVTYRFRLSAKMENGGIKDVTITQQT